MPLGWGNNTQACFFAIYFWQHAVQNGIDYSSKERQPPPSAL